MVKPKVPTRKSQNYAPMTCPKRFKGKSRKTFKASQRLNDIMVKLDRKTTQIFTDMANYSKSNSYKVPSEVPYGDFFRRLTASRIHCADSPQEKYVSSKKTPFKTKSLQTEMNAIKLFCKPSDLLVTGIEFYHPDLFFLSAIPDGVVKSTNSYMIIEVKTIFTVDGAILNEMGDIFDETNDIQRWKNQLSFSLKCCAITLGYLLVYDYETEKLFASFEVNTDIHVNPKELMKWKELFVREILLRNACFRGVSDRAKSRFFPRVMSTFNTLLSQHLEASSFKHSQDLIDFSQNRLNQIFSNEMKTVVLEY